MNPFKLNEWNGILQRLADRISLLYYRCLSLLALVSFLDLCYVSSEAQAEADGRPACLP